MDQQSLFLVPNSEKMSSASFPSLSELLRIYLALFLYFPVIKPVERLLAVGKCLQRQIKTGS